MKALDILLFAHSLLFALAKNSGEMENLKLCFVSLVGLMKNELWILFITERFKKWPKITSSTEKNKKDSHLFCIFNFEKENNLKCIIF